MKKCLFIAVLAVGFVVSSKAQSITFNNSTSCMSGNDYVKFYTGTCATPVVATTLDIPSINPYTYNLGGPFTPLFHVDDIKKMVIHDGATTYTIDICNYGWGTVYSNYYCAGPGSGPTYWSFSKNSRGNSLTITMW
jgi:hypothetical protein